MLTKPVFIGPSKWTIPQVYHNLGKEATHNTIEFWHLQVLVKFLTSLYIVYGPNTCWSKFVPRGLKVVFNENTPNIYSKTHTHRTSLSVSLNRIVGYYYPANKLWLEFSCCNFTFLRKPLNDRLYIGWSKKVAQFLVGHNFETASKNSTKLHTAFFQHVFNHFVNF